MLKLIETPPVSVETDFYFELPEKAWNFKFQLPKKMRIQRNKISERFEAGFFFVK